MELAIDTPDTWKRQVVYIMDEMFHALKQSITANTEEDRLSWMKRADYLRGKAQQCIHNAFHDTRSVIGVLHGDDNNPQKEETNNE